MITWIKNLSVSGKILLAVGVLILAVIIFDASTGYMREFHNWMFDRQQAKIEQKNKELEVSNQQIRDENIKLRAEQNTLVKQALEVKAKEAVLNDREKSLDTKTKEQLAKTEQALKQQEQEERVTAEPIDDYTRCLRARDKMLALKIPAAKNMTCEEYNK